jgi:AcrR family transcriptional regulator
MTSIRNNLSTGERLLDAAREGILAVGWRRTTLTDVARRAGVSRMTVYRTYPDMTSLFGDLMTREWVGVLADLGDVEPAGDLAHEVAARMLAAVRALRLNPLFQRIVDVDPELLLPYLLDRRGRSQQAVVELLARTIEDGQTIEDGGATGGLRAGNPVLMARSIVLACQGFVLSPQTMVDEAVTPEELDAELLEMIAGRLQP